MSWRGSSGITAGTTAWTPNIAVPEYEHNLVNLIKDVRRDLKSPNLPVVIGELTGPWVKAEGQWDAVRKAAGGCRSSRGFCRHGDICGDARLRPQARGFSEPHARPSRIRQRGDVFPRGGCFGEGHDQASSWDTSKGSQVCRPLVFRRRTPAANDLSLAAKAGLHELGRCLDDAGRQSDGELHAGDGAG